MTNIRYPKITGRTPEEKIAQMESFLRQLVDQLNWLLPMLEQGNVQNQPEQNSTMNGYSRR